MKNFAFQISSPVLTYSYFNCVRVECLLKQLYSFLRRAIFKVAQVICF